MLMPEVNLYRQIINECRRAAVPVIAFSMFINVLMLTTAIYMLQVYDRVLASYSLETLAALSLIAVLALLTLAALEIVRSRLLIALGDWIYVRLSPVLFVAGVERAASVPGSTADRGLRDLEQIRSFISGSAILPVLDVPWVPIFLIAIFVIHPWLGWMALAGGAVLFLLALLAEVMTRDLLGRAHATQQQAYRQAEAASRNAEAIQAMGMLSAVARLWADVQTFSSRMQTQASEYSSIIASVARFLRLSLQIGILGVGAYLVLAGDMRAGGMIAASILMGRALSPVEQAITTWKAIVGFRDASSRIGDVIRRDVPSTAAMPMSRPSGRLAVEKLSLQLGPQERFILDEISFELEEGEVLGLIGPSAAGKTSLARLLVGVWKPSRGRVLLDGLDVAHWNAGDRGQYVGYLPQDVELFSGTVKDNIGRFGDLSERWPAVIRAAEMADVHTLVKGLPKGYETQIGEGGASLSGGQRQRIGLARALFGDPALIVLDEPNANLDREGEDALQSTIKRLKEAGRTVVVIAHRPQILAAVDKILLLREGKVDLFGPRGEVMNAMAARSRPAIESSEPVSLPQRAARRVVVVRQDGT